MIIVIDCSDRCNMAKGDNMTKKKLALEVIERLKNEYPDAVCTLAYDKAWQLLVSVRLAAQCTDASTASSAVSRTPVET